jgi:antitoxin VapB
MATAKVFKNGNSQAVRLPREFNTKEDEFFIKKDGDLIMLIPKDKVWGIFKEGIEELSDDFLRNGREQPGNQKRKSID